MPRIFSPRSLRFAAEKQRAIGHNDHRNELELNESLGGNNVMLRALNIFTLTVIACACIMLSGASQAAQLSVKNYKAYEYQQTARVTVELSEAVTDKVTLHFSTQPGTALNGKDFYGTHEVIEFAPGQTRKQIPLVILNDTELESEERFTATIWGAEGATIERAVASVIIVDDDGDGSDVPAVSLSSVTANENAGSVAVKIELSMAAPRAVSVLFATSADSATPGKDFYGTSGNVRFAVGETSKTVSIELLDDELDEGDESFNINLYEIFGAAPGVVAGTVTLKDDDRDPGTNDAALTAHVLNRLGFGAANYGLAQIESLGIDGYIESQLTRSPVIPLCDKCVEAELTDAKIARAVSSQRQLSEVLVDFWFNHFNVDTVNNVVRYDLGKYETEYIRRNIFGKFEDMLIAVAKSPAMLEYLDNQSSTKEGLRIGDRVRGLNENYARELMELHTLGVEAPYTEEDVITVARILTGWSFTRDPADATRRVYLFRDRYHDTDPKNFMNGTLIIDQDGGEEEGMRLLRLLARHPSTARYVSSKLIQRFVSETPPESLVAAAADTWTSTQGDLRAVMRTILMSDEFRDPANFGSKIKSPLHLVASASRAMRLGSVPERLEKNYRDLLISQGQEMYKVAPPTGVPENTNFWVSSSAMLARFDGMTEMVADDGLRGGVVIGDGDANKIVTDIIAIVMPQGVSDATKSTVVAHIEAMPSGATLDERKSEALLLLFSSPEFMRH